MPLLDWNRLLSDRRVRSPKSQAAQATAAAPVTPTTAVSPAVASSTATVASTASTRTEFEKDYDRVIFSAPFRLLAGKTQVHPFASLDHVHNRLTHTLEVASVGRSLAYAVGRLLSARNELPANRTAEDLSCIVQAACLAHDIGNPPFGHAGEYAIRAWSQQHLARLFPAETGTPLAAIIRDWQWFEGNAQSFRLVSRLNDDDQPYYRLTYASLGALIKYPWTSSDSRTPDQGKYNVFSTDQPLFDDLANTLGLRRSDGTVARHPLSFLSETADDICYRISDFEDAVDMRILPEKAVREIFLKIIGDPEARGPISALRARAIGRLVEAAVNVFTDDYAAILAGERQADLKTGFPPQIREALKTIKDDYQSIFNHRRKVAVELGAPQTLGRILETYLDAIRALTDASCRGYDQLGFVHRRCFALAAWEEKFVRENEKQDAAWWLGRVMDHVSGMTDAYATQVSKEIAGL